MKKISVIIFSIVLIFLPLLSQAAGLVPCGGSGQAACQLCDIFVLFKNVVDFLLKYIVPSLAVLMIAIGGFMYVFAYLSPAEALPGGGKGGPSMLSQAKRLLTSVVFGLVIVFGAWLIVNFFFQMIGVQDWTGLKSGWWQLNCTTSNSNQSQLANVNQATAQQVLSNAVTNQVQNPGNSVLSSNELKDYTMFMNVWQSSGQQPNWSSVGPNSGQTFGDIFDKAQSISQSSPNQMSTMQSLFSQQGQARTFNNGTAQNNFNFMSQLANSLNYNQGLVAQSQGTSFSFAGQGVSSDINMAYIDRQVQKEDGTIVTYGRTTDGLDAVTVEKNGVTTMSAMDERGNIVKMTTIDQYGNIQNLTGKFDQSGNLSLAGNGSQNFSGQISAANLGNINTSMSSFLGQMSGIGNILNSGSTPSQSNIGSLYNSAQGFQNSMFAGLNNTPQSITSLANMNNMPTSQMSSMFNNTLLGNMNYIAAQSNNGTTFQSPSTLSTLYGQGVTNTYNVSSLPAMSQMSMMGNIGSMQSLMNSPSYASLLSSPQGQSLLQTLYQAQQSAQNSPTGQPSQALVNQSLSQFTSLMQTQNGLSLLNSPQMFNTMSMSSPASSVYNNSTLGVIGFIASKSTTGTSFQSPSTLSGAFGQSVTSGTSIPGMANMNQMFTSSSVGPMQNIMNNTAFNNMLATPQGIQLLTTMNQMQTTFKQTGQINPSTWNNIMSQYTAMFNTKEGKSFTSGNGSQANEYENITESSGFTGGTNTPEYDNIVQGSGYTGSTPGAQDYFDNLNNTEVVSSPYDTQDYGLSQNQYPNTDTQSTYSNNGSNISYEVQNNDSGTYGEEEFMYPSSDTYDYSYNPGSEMFSGANFNAATEGLDTMDFNVDMGGF